MIINGFGNGSGGTLESSNIIKTLTTSISANNPVSGLSGTPPTLSTAVSNSNTSGSNKNYRIISVNSGDYITSDDILRALRIYQSVQLFVTVNSITPPTINMTAWVSGNTGTTFTWPLGCLIVFGYGSNLWYNSYYRMCTATSAVKGSTTETISPSSYSSMALYRNASGYVPVMNRIGLTSTGEGLIINLGTTTLVSTIAPAFARGEISLWVCWATGVTPFPSGANFSSLDSLTTSGGSISLTFTFVGY